MANLCENRVSKAYSRDSLRKHKIAEQFLQVITGDKRTSCYKYYILWKEFSHDNLF